MGIQNKLLGAGAAVGSSVAALTKIKKASPSAEAAEKAKASLEEHKNSKRANLAAIPKPEEKKED